MSVLASDDSPRTGWQHPRTRKQLFSWCAQLVSLTNFWIVVLLLFLEAPPTLFEGAVNLVVAHTITVLISIYFWVFLEIHDPSEPSCFSRLLSSGSPRWTAKKYCRVHKKKIEGLDHFCQWLNVSIGRSNYIPFVVLVGLGCLQFCLQIAFCVLCLALWRQDAVENMNSRALEILFMSAAAANVCVSAPALCMYGMLLFFHAYLCTRGISTYEYTIEQSGKHSGNRAARRVHTSNTAAATTTSATAATMATAIVSDSAEESQVGLEKTESGGGGSSNTAVELV